MTSPFALISNKNVYHNQNTGFVPAPAPQPGMGGGMMGMPGMGPPPQMGAGPPGGSVIPPATAQEKLDDLF